MPAAGRGQRRPRPRTRDRASGAGPGGEDDPRWDMEPDGLPAEPAEPAEPAQPVELASRARRGRPAIRPPRPRTIRSERSGPGRPPGGSELKKAAVVQAARELFLRDGFERTSVDAIADLAGVSKRTIYNHYEDKRTLFLAVIHETFGTMIEAIYAIIDKHMTDVADPEESLTGFAVEGAMLAFRSADRAAMIRLLIAEAGHFPELQREEMRPFTVTDRLARRLAAMAERGLLDITDPHEAADHLFALTFGQLNNRSLFGTRPLPDAEIRRMAVGGVRAFVRAYPPGRPAGLS
jgi:TetR/AcrR family transcriptional regulator, mexJK operon transcriptional repressor